MWLYMVTPRLRDMTDGEMTKLSMEIMKSWYGDKKSGMNSSSILLGKEESLMYGLREMVVDKE